MKSKILYLFTRTPLHFGAGPHHSALSAVISTVVHPVLQSLVEDPAEGPEPAEWECVEGAKEEARSSFFSEG